MHSLLVTIGTLLILPKMTHPSDPPDVVEHYQVEYDSSVPSNEYYHLLRKNQEVRDTFREECITYPPELN